MVSETIAPTDESRPPAACAPYHPDRRTGDRGGRPGSRLGTPGVAPRTERLAAWAGTEGLLVPFQGVWPGSFRLGMVLDGLGCLLTSRAARRWPGVVSAGDVHQHVSLLGLAFGMFHGLILLGDRYANYRLTQLLIPFATTAYRPLWVGLGQLASTRSLSSP